MGVGTNLRRLRAKKGISQQEIADIIGVDRKTYINWENETNDVKSEYLPQLADIFQVGIGDLFTSSLSKIEIIQNNHNESKDTSILNGAILLITDKEIVEDIINTVKNRYVKGNNEYD